MKKIGYLVIIAVLFSNSFGMLPSRVQARPSDEEMAQQLLTFLQAMYPWSQKVLTHFSQTHNIEVNATNFESQVKRIYPKTYQYTQEQFRRELGLVNVSLPNGAPPKSAGGPGWYGLLFAWFSFLVVHYRNQDEDREQFCRADLMSAPNNFTFQEAEKECNWQSDQSFELADILTIITPLGVPAKWFVQMEEWIRERNQGRRYSIWYYLYEGPGHRRPRPPQNQRKPPADSGLGGGGCGFAGSAFSTTSSFGPYLPPGFVGPPSPEDYRLTEVFTTVDFGCDGIPGTPK